MVKAKARVAALLTLTVVAALIAWCAMMWLYSAAHDLVQQNTVPVTLQIKQFSAHSWDQGYFNATGAFENQSAFTSGDDLLPQSNAITCLKDSKICIVATGSIFNHYLDVDAPVYDITSWTDQQITFSDDSPICVTNSYVIDRAAQTVTLIVRKRATLPDYVKKSELHPCDKTQDANIELVDGFKVSDRARAQFETRYGIYFHASLIAMNILFFGAIYWLWRRRNRAVLNSGLQSANLA